MNVQKHLLGLVLIPLSIIAIALSYHRFIVAEDYVVEYEGYCDPYTQSCFVGCTDDSCAEIYYYTWIQKTAASVREQCGPNVSECESAGECAPGEEGCSVRFCSMDTVSEDEMCDSLEPADIEAEAETVDGEQANEEELSV
jgi:hypothetical protein